MIKHVWSFTANLNGVLKERSGQLRASWPRLCAGQWVVGFPIDDLKRVRAVKHDGVGPFGGVWEAGYPSSCRGAVLSLAHHGDCRVVKRAATGTAVRKLAFPRSASNCIPIAAERSPFFIGCAPVLPSGVVLWDGRRFPPFPASWRRGWEVVESFPSLALRATVFASFSLTLRGVRVAALATEGAFTAASTPEVSAGRGWVPACT